MTRWILGLVIIGGIGLVGPAGSQEPVKDARPASRAEKNQERYLRIRDQLQREQDQQTNRARQLRQGMEASVAIPIPTNIGEASNAIKAEALRLSVELAGLEARKASLAEQMAQLTARASKSGDQDPVASELRKLIDRRQVAVEHMSTMYSKGMVSATEKANAEAGVIEARVKLEERLAAIRASVGDASRLSDRLIDTTIAIAETRARQAAVASQLKQLDQIHDSWRQYENALRRAELIQRQVDELEQVIRNLEVRD